MTAKSDAQIKWGRDLRDRLRAEKRHIDAQIVQDICLLLTHSVRTNERLHRDLQEARRAAGLEAMPGRDG